MRTPLDDESLRDLLQDMGHVDLEIYMQKLVRAVEYHISHAADSLHTHAEPDEPCSMCRMRLALKPFQTRDETDE